MLSEAVFPIDDTFLHAALAGLSDTPKTLPCKYLYDQRGAELLAALCATEAHYVTHVEHELLERHGRELAGHLPDGFRLVELGADASGKCEALLRVARSAGVYIPVSPREGPLQALAARIVESASRVRVAPLALDFERPFALPPSEETSRTMVTLLGSAIGSFEPLEATRMLRRLSRLAGPNGYVLLGVERKTDPAVLTRAYHDPQGLRAELHLNLLARCNRELGSDFSLQAFVHHAFYDPQRGCVEMHLVSKSAERVKIDEHTFTFDEGESIRTERSYKYSIAQFRSVARSAGLVHVQTWSDEREWFSLMLFGANSD